MTLTTRLTTFFLSALAFVLIGFSATLFLLARSYLHRQLDKQLEAALNTLIAAAEMEPGGIEWDRRDRTVQIEGTAADSAVVWTVHDNRGHLLDYSLDLAAGDSLRGELAEASEGALLHWSGDGDSRRYLRRRLQAAPGVATEPSDGKKKHGSLTFTTAASNRPVNGLLRSLAIALIGISAGVWMVALVGGRWFCRRALSPITRMADQAKGMRAEEDAGRLAVPATRDEVEALGRSVNGLLDRLHEALERQRRFTGDASHQLRTPLAALLGQVEVTLRHQRSAEEYRQTLSDVQEQGHNLRRIVEMLLYLARSNAEARLEDLENIDLAAWLPGHLRTWSRHPRAADLHLEMEAWKTCPVKVQGPLLGQLLDNLLDNSCKYSEPGTKIIVGLSAADGEVMLSVEDEGTGIEPEDLPHVFEPFFRSAKARGQGHSGVGLGLSIASRIAALFHGTLAAFNRSAKGSRFLLRLPAAGHDDPDRA